jgi:cytochrome P450
MGHGLFMAEGDTWRAQRKLVHPVFNRERIDGMAPLVRRLARETFDTWERQYLPGETAFDFHHAVRDLTLRIASVGIVGTDVFERAPELRDVLERLWVHSGRRLRWGTGLFDRLPIAANAQYRADLLTLDNAVRTAMKTHEHSTEFDLLRVLLDAKNTAGEHLDPNQVRDEVVTFLLAGQECTSIALAWCMYVLGQHPAVERALVDQLSTFASDEELDGNSHRRAPLLRQVLREAMRLYPPSWMIPRQAIGMERVAGHSFAPNSVVFLCTWNLHRDKALWPDPTRFDPTRFAPDAPQRDKFGFLPFGVGPRMCIGMSLAMMQAEVILAMLLRRFRVEPLDQKVVPDPGLTLRPQGGVRVSIRHRSA